MTTRQAPWRSESGNTDPPKRREKRWAASRGSAQATSTSSTARPRTRSRMAPPTTHASSPSRSSRSRSAIDRDPASTARARIQPDGDLVADGVGNARMVLDEHAVADQRYRGAGCDLAVQYDRERVHRD